MIVAAFFQDILIAATRILAGRSLARGRPPVRAAGDRLVRVGRAAATAVGRIAVLPHRLVGRVRIPRRALRPARVEPPAPARELPWPAAEDESAPPRDAPGTLEQPRERDELRRGPTYVPSSRIHVDESVRVYLATRNGQAPVDGLVRHLNERFGTGLGIELIEGLRKRGVISVQRDRLIPTRLVAHLRPAARTDNAGQ